MKLLSNRFGKGNKKNGDELITGTPQSDHSTPMEVNDYQASPLVGAGISSPYGKAVETGGVVEAYQQFPASRQTNPQNGGSRRALNTRNPSGPVSVDSPDTSPGSSEPSSPANSSAYNFSPEHSRKKPPLGTGALFEPAPFGSSQKDMSQLGQESFSSVCSDGDNPYPKRDIRYLQTQLRDAQHVVKTVVGVERVDRNSCLKATIQYNNMQKELEQLRQNYRSSLETQEDLETQLAQSRLEASQNYVANSALDRKLQRSQLVETKELHSEGRLSASSSLADHVGAATLESEDYFTKSYEEHLESQLASMRELLDQRQTEVDKLQQGLKKERSQGKESSSLETNQMKRDLDEAREEIAELEKEQHLNIAEIVTLSRKVRSASEIQKSVGNGGNDREYELKYEEAQMRIEELEEDRVVRIRNEEEMSKHLDDAQSRLSTFKDLDSDVDYPQRIAVLEKRLEKKTKQNVKALVKKDEEIETLKMELEEQKLQSTSWEKSANESSAQVMKMASHMSEKEEYMISLEDENRELNSHLEEAETKTAELEDKHWMRDQKLSGMETMYQESQRKIKMLAGENESIRSIFSVERSAANALRAEGTITSMNRSVREEEGERRIVSLTIDLEQSAQKLQKISVELESSRTKEASTRKKLDRLKEENEALENQLAELESRLRSEENRRSSQSAVTMGLEAKQVAVQARMLKLEQENRALRRKLDRMDGQIRAAEKKGTGDGASVGSEENINMNMEIQASRSAMSKLQMELVETKLKIEETERTLEKERTSHSSNVKKLTQDLEDSKANLSLPDGSFEGHIETKRMRVPVPLDDSMQDDSSIQISLGESYNEAPGQSSVEVGVLIEDLKAQLAKKEEQLRRKEEDYAMQVDQVDGLRSRLQETLTSLEDLEYERNFNNAKVSELTLLTKHEDGDDSQELLRQKAIQIAELDTKLEKALKEATERDNLIEKLEQESSMNKSKVAELSAIWANQAKDGRARNNVLAKAIEVAELLDESNQRIEELEAEKGELAAEYAALNLKLAKSMQMARELGERLEKEKRSKKELEQIMEASGIQIIDMEADNDGNPNARKRAVSQPNRNPDENDRIRQLEETLNQQQAIIATLARGGPMSSMLTEEHRDETASDEEHEGLVSSVVAKINESGISALSPGETE